MCVCVCVCMCAEGMQKNRVNMVKSNMENYVKGK